MRPSSKTTWSARRWGRAAAARPSTADWPKSAYSPEPLFFSTFTTKTEATKAINTGARGLNSSKFVPDAALQPPSDAHFVITHADGSLTEVTVLLCIETPIDLDHCRASGIFPSVLSHSLQDKRV